MDMGGQAMAVNEQRQAMYQQVLNARKQEDDRNLVIADRLISESIDRWLGSLDRSRLGFFALPLDVLAAADALGYAKELRRDWEIAVSETEPEDATFGIVTALGTRLDQAIGRSGMNKANLITSNPPIVELMFWWGLTHDYEYHTEADVYHSENNARHLDKINLVIDNPEMHSYFAAGIWDVPFIESCIAEGVDPSIALDMLGADDVRGKRP